MILVGGSRIPAAVCLGGTFVPPEQTGKGLRMAMKIRHLMVGMIGTNCYLVENDETKKGFIVDPGGNAPEILETLAQMEMQPEAILLTHGHADHISGIPGIEEKRQIPVFALAAEKHVLHDTTANLTDEFYGGRGFTVDADRYLADGEELSLAGFRIRVIATPGHTEGSCCYYLPEAGVLFSGDTLFQMSYGRTDMPTGSGRAIEASVAKLLRLPPKTQVLPGHMGFTTIETERKFNPLADSGADYGDPESGEAAK